MFHSEHGINSAVMGASAILRREFQRFVKLTVFGDEGEL